MDLYLTSNGFQIALFILITVQDDVTSCNFYDDYDNDNDNKNNIGVSSDGGCTVALRRPI